jgi:hypothetical protein
MFTGISMLGVYFFALPLLSGAGSVFHQPSLLSMCYEGSLALGVVHWLKK